MPLPFQAEGKEAKMLILTRRIGESLVIDDEIDVVVLSVEGNQVRLGVDAPGDVDVHREEVWERIQEQDEEPVPVVAGP